MLAGEVLPALDRFTSLFESDDYYASSPSSSRWHHRRASSRRESQEMWIEGRGGCLIGYLERRHLAGTSEMVFVPEVPNWLSAGCVQLVDMPCLIHKCLHLILIFNFN